MNQTEKNENWRKVLSTHCKKQNNIYGISRNILKQIFFKPESDYLFEERLIPQTRLHFLSETKHDPDYHLQDKLITAYGAYLLAVVCEEEVNKRQHIKLKDLRTPVILEICQDYFVNKCSLKLLVHITKLELLQEVAKKWRTPENRNHLHKINQDFTLYKQQVA
jgi:hypothetical protein